MMYMQALLVCLNNYELGPLTTVTPRDDSWLIQARYLTNSFIDILTSCNVWSCGSAKTCFAPLVVFVFRIPLLCLSHEKAPDEP